MAMTDETKNKLAEFAARFRAQRLEGDKRKAEAKDAKKAIEIRKAENTRFHQNNPILPPGVKPSVSEDADYLANLYNADAVNWIPQAVVVTGQWQECKCCGHFAKATSGFFFREQHKMLPSAKRLRAIDHIPDGFIVEMAVEGVVLPRCINCLDAHPVDDLFTALLHGGELRYSNQLELF